MERVTGEGIAILGGSWLLALWAHAALPGALPFALALAFLFAGAALLAGRTTGAVVAGGAAGRSGTGARAPESAELGGLRAELRGLEAELHALTDRERTERFAPDGGVRGLDGDLAEPSVSRLSRRPDTTGGAAR